MIHQDVDLISDLESICESVAQWSILGARYASRISTSILDNVDIHDEQKEQAITLLLELGRIQEARQAVLAWLSSWRAQLPAQLTHKSDPDSIINPFLCKCLADVSERCGDTQLPEIFWQSLEKFRPVTSKSEILPLLGVPILNGVKHLKYLLASLDVPVGILAIVDQSGGRHDSDSLALRQELKQLELEGCPGVDQVRVARPFNNIGVAAAWNLILRSFVDAPLALLLNHDVQLSSGVLGKALQQMDSGRPQFMPLLPGERAYSAFLLTALAWDVMGLFDERFHPAYFEDLDYRDRLLACPQVERLDGSFAYQSMLQMNPLQSATIHSDPSLQLQNRRSFQLNRLWYLHRRRGPASSFIQSGQWRQRWLAKWI